MKFIPKNVKKFQQGGEMAPAEDPAMQAPAEQGQDPMMMLAEAASQAISSGDCQIAMQVCQGLVDLLAQMSGGAPQGEPVFKKGGILLRRIKK